MAKFTRFDSRNKKKNRHKRMEKDLRIHEVEKRRSKSRISEYVAASVVEDWDESWEKEKT